MHPHTSSHPPTHAHTSSLATCLGWRSRLSQLPAAVTGVWGRCERSGEDAAAPRPVSTSPFQVASNNSRRWPLPSPPPSLPPLPSPPLPHLFLPSPPRPPRAKITRGRDIASSRVTPPPLTEGHRAIHQVQALMCSRQQGGGQLSPPWKGRNRDTCAVSPCAAPGSVPRGTAGRPASPGARGQ